MGDDMAFVGVVPALAHVFDQLPGVVYQRIINGNHASGAVARFGAPPATTPSGGR
jgi:hypothetical protein